MENTIYTPIHVFGRKTLSIGPLWIQVQLESINPYSYIFIYFINKYNMMENDKYTPIHVFGRKL